MYLRPYNKLTTLTTNYASRMTKLSNRIFGNGKRPINKSNQRVVDAFSKQPLYTNDYIINYYPRHMETGKLMMKLREYGLFRDEHLDFKDEMKRLRELRGKGKPKKERTPYPPKDDQDD